MDEGEWYWESLPAAIAIYRMRGEEEEMCECLMSASGFI